MDLFQTVFLTAALSLPVVTLIALGRAALCVFRSHQAKHLKFTLFSILAMVIMLVVFAAVIVVWFAYGVAHTGKNATTDLVVLASTGIPVYVGAFCVWRLSVYMENRFEKDAR